MNKYRLVIFDLDGTLLNTREGSLASVRYTIDAYGLSPLSPEQMDAFIGPPIQESFAAAYGLSGSILQDLATTFRNRYKDVDLLKAEPYAGIFDVLRELKARGILLAVATYKRADYAYTILKHFGFTDYFDFIHGADHENKLKKSDMIELCINDAGITDRSEILLVGDTKNDEIGAVNAGIDFLGVTYGFGYRSDDEILNSQSVGFASCTGDILSFL